MWPAESLRSLLPEYLPQVGDYVQTPLGSGQVVGMAVYVLHEGWVWKGRQLDHGPFVVRLDDGREEGFRFDHMRR